MRTKRVLSVMVTAMMLGSMAGQCVPQSVLADEQNTTEVTTVLKGSSQIELPNPGKNAVSEMCGESTNWAFDPDTNTLFVQGEGDVVSMTYASDKWQEYAPLAEELVIEAGITSLPSECFAACSALKRLTIPRFGLSETDTEPSLRSFFGNSTIRDQLESITVLSGQAVPDSYFKEMEQLQSVTLADTIAVIGTDAFRGSALLKEVHFPAGLTEIRDAAFYDCKALESVALPEGLTAIGSFAFGACGALASVTLPETLKSIGDEAFRYCGSLTKMTVPNSVTEMGNNIFANNEKLTSLSLPFAYSLKGIDALTSVSITGGTEIPENYFRERTELKQITLADSITAIGSAAFYCCTGLTAITLPAKLQTIGEFAFSGCSALTAVSVPASVTAIAGNAFRDCAALETVTMQKGLQTLGENAFRGCSLLKKMELPDTLTSIGNWAFYGCSGITELVIPNSVETLGEALFGTECSLQSVTLPYAGRNANDRECSLKRLLNGNSEQASAAPASVAITGGTFIPSWFFNEYGAVTSISLPDTLTAIESCAFCGLSELTALKIPSGVMSIGEKAFTGCTALKDLTIPKTVDTVGANAFGDTAWYAAQKNGIVYAGGTAIGFKGDFPQNYALKFAEGTIGIGDYAFKGVSAVSLSLPDGLLNIGNHAFEECRNLTELVIPDSVDSLGSEAFRDCSGLKSITVPATVSNIGYAPFMYTSWEDQQAEGPVYIGRTFYGYKGAMKHGTVLTLRDGTTDIADSALAGCEDLAGIVLPDTLKHIGNEAFRNCISLTEIKIPDGVTSLGANAFEGCTALKEAKLSESLTILRGGTFYGCRSLSKADIPASVRTIQSSAFENCISLTDIVMSGEITSEMDSNVFAYNTDLTNGQPLKRTLTITDGSVRLTNYAAYQLRTAVSVKLPDSLEVIDSNALKDFSNITEITIPDSVKTIGDCAFLNCTALESVQSPATLERIGSSAFENCTALKKADLSAGKADSIGDNAFWKCSALETVLLPETLTTVGNSAFSECSALNAIVLPDSVTVLGEYAFYNCSSLKSAKLSESLTALPIDLFQNCTALEAITIPASVKTVDRSFRNCISLLTVTLSDSITEVSGAAYDYDTELTEGKLLDRKVIVADGSTQVNRAMLGSLRDQITEIELPDTVTALEDGVFENSRLTAVTIPNGITMIPERAFAGSAALRTVKLSESVTAIGAKAFQGCSELRDLELPKKLTAIEYRAFNDCNALGSIVLPDTLLTLGSEIFEGCTALKTAVLPKEIKAIPSGMFRNCIMLSEISLPESVGSIDDGAFYNCTSLADITLTDYVKQIDNDAFGMDKNHSVPVRILHIAEGSVRISPTLIAGLRSTMTGITLPESVTAIQDYAFSGCSRLQTMEIPETVREIGTYAFEKCSALKEITIPKSISVLSEGTFSQCTSLKTVTLPDAVKLIPAHAFENCASLESFNSSVQKFQFKANSFTGCVSFYDQRFNLIDRHHVNFSANTDTVQKDGLVNLAVQYTLNDELMSGPYQLRLIIPDGVIPIYSTLDDDGEYDLDGNSIILKNTSAAENIRFSVRTQEYGSFRLTAAVGFYFDNTFCEEGLGSVDVYSPELSICAPETVNRLSVTVNGVAAPGSEVTVCVDGEAVTTAKSSDKTGKYVASLLLPKKEDSLSYELTAQCGETVSAPVTVAYGAAEPVLEQVVLGYNAHIDTQTDITEMFTAGKTPVITYNPAYPLQFDIKLGNPEAAGDVIVTSTKGGETKYMEANWIPEEGIFRAFGYFDPNNTAYVPGTIGIYTAETFANTINLETGEVTASEAVMQALYGQSTKNLKEDGVWDGSYDALPQVVKDNSRLDVDYQSSNSVNGILTVSNGKSSAQLGMYYEQAESAFIANRAVSADEAAKNPGAYGFVKLPTTFYDPATKSYVDAYIKSINGKELAYQILDNYERNLESDSSTAKDNLGFIARFTSGIGAYMLYVCRPENQSNAEFLPGVVGEAQDAANAVTGHAGYTVTGVVADVGTTAMEYGLNNPGAVRTFIDTSSPGFQEAGTCFNTIGTTMNVLSTVMDGVNTYDRANAIGMDPALQQENLMLFGVRTLIRWGLPAVGTALGGPVGTAIGTVGAAAIDTYIIKRWEDDLNNRINDKNKPLGQGRIKPIIDPSGYVYEAIEENRISGAKMTIFYKNPETGEETEWTADEYEQKNPLLTDQDGVYAWDVPEGLWRVKFELEGYETMYSEWMDVPPIRTDVNFSAVSLAEPKLLSVIAADGKVILTFSKYMDISTLTADTVQLLSDGKDVAFKIKAVSGNDKFADTFVLEPADGTLPTGALSVSFTDGVKSYSGTAMTAQNAEIVRPAAIVTFTADNNLLTVAASSEAEITLRAVPASMAAGKHITLTDSQRVAALAEDAVFDKNGIATVKLHINRTGKTELTFGIEGETITCKVVLYALEEVAYNEAFGEEDAPKQFVGDINNDGTINLKDAVMLRRYIAGGWNVTVNEAAADINGDGTVNMKDVVLLRRFIAGGWGVSLKGAA